MSENKDMEKNMKDKPTATYCVCNPDDMNFPVQFFETLELAQKYIDAQLLPLKVIGGFIIEITEEEAKKLQKEGVRMLEPISNLKIKDSH